MAKNQGFRVQVDGQVIRCFKVEADYDVGSITTHQRDGSQSETVKDWGSVMITPEVPGMPYAPEKAPDMDLRNRRHLIDIREQAEKCQEVSANRHWKDAYQSLAQATDRIDAMLARSEDGEATQPVSPKVNDDDNPSKPD